MIHIKYKLGVSDTHGVGLFADQDIEPDDLIYTPNPLLDLNLTQDEFEQLTPGEQREVQYYGYFHEPSGRWHVAFEAIRFLNHAPAGHANVTQNREMVMKAVRRVLKGEELFQDYSEIYPADGDHFGRINSRS